MFVEMIPQIFIGVANGVAQKRNIVKNLIGWCMRVAIYPHFNITLVLTNEIVQITAKPLVVRRHVWRFVFGIRQPTHWQVMRQHNAIAVLFYRVFQIFTTAAMQFVVLLAVKIRNAVHVIDFMCWVVNVRPQGGANKTVIVIVRVRVV